MIRITRKTFQVCLKKYSLTYGRGNQKIIWLDKKSTASVETVLRYRSALPSPGAL